MSSFQKMNNISGISGQKISTGHKFLDFILGKGGMPIGSIILLEEDKYIVHAHILSRYFISEGITQKQPIFAACLDKDPRQIIQSIPAPCEEINKEAPSEMSDEMRIAWRYNSLPKFDSSELPNTTKNYDLSKKIKSELIERSNISYWDGEEEEILENEQNLFLNERYQSLLNSIHRKIKEECDGGKNILRVSITSICSPCWFDENIKKDFVKFLLILKALIKNTSAVCFITIPIHLYEENNLKFVEQIRNLVDFVFELKSISNVEDVRSIYKEYTGLFNIKKLSAVNTLANHYQGTFDLAYKITRKNFVIETFHLPPDIPESATDGIESTEAPSLDCGSTNKHLLEF